MTYTRDYRDESGTGYVFEEAEDAGFRWTWTEPPWNDEPCRVWFSTLAEALRDAAEDWESNGSGGKRAAVLRGQATKAEKA